jgi:hypothetical protein
MLGRTPPTQHTVVEETLLRMPGQEMEAQEAMGERRMMRGRRVLWRREGMLSGLVGEGGMRWIRQGYGCDEGG